MDERTERAMAAVAVAVGGVIAEQLGGGGEIERRFEAAMRRCLGELVWARETARPPRRPGSLEVANEASVIALCAVASARAQARDAATSGLDAACDVNRAARTAAVHTWERALGVSAT